jgi:uncharacterized membrane protein YfcA
METTLANGALLTGLGLIAGILNVLAGGGSLLTLPAMILMGMPAPVANGTNRLGVLAQNLFATAAFFRRGYREWKLSLSFSLATLPGVVAGARLGTHFEGVWFNRTLAALMIAILIWTARPPRVIPATTALASRKRLITTHLWMLAIGFYGGFIQAGLGFVIMALLNRKLGMDLVRVNMHKVFIVGFLTIVALAIFAAEGKVLWPAAICLGLGNALGGWIGAHVTINKGETFIRIVLNVTLVAMAIKLLMG